MSQATNQNTTVIPALHTLGRTRYERDAIASIAASFAAPFAASTNSARSWSLVDARVLPNCRALRRFRSATGACHDETGKFAKKDMCKS
jgi:hypothetical protein